MWEEGQADCATTKAQAALMLVSALFMKKNAQPRR
jgi:hypothetical protein